MSNANMCLDIMSKTFPSRQSQAAWRNQAWLGLILLIGLAGSCGSDLVLVNVEKRASSANTDTAWNGFRCALCDATHSRLAKTMCRSTLSIWIAPMAVNRSIRSRARPSLIRLRFSGFPVHLRVSSQLLRPMSRLMSLPWLSSAQTDLSYRPIE